MPEKRNKEKKTACDPKNQRKKTATCLFAAVATVERNPAARLSQPLKETLLRDALCHTESIHPTASTKTITRGAIPTSAQLSTARSMQSFPWRRVEIEGAC
jgi:hypothetical protein